MSEQEKTEKPTAKPAARRGKTLSLKRTVESGQVRQSFSHGRFKSVLVEKRRKRIINPDQSTQKPAESETPPITENADSDKKNNFDSLSQSEQEARMAAVTEAKARAAEIAQQEEIERQQKEAQAAQAAQYKSAEDKSVKAEKTQADDIVSRKAKSVKSADFTPLQPAPPSQPQPTGRKGKEEKQEAPRKLAPTKRSEPRRRTGKLTINDALKNEDRVRSMASIRRRRERERRQSMSHEPREKIARTIILPETITIQELANRMAERAADVIKLLMQQNVMAKINDTIDADTAELIAGELGHKVNRVTESDIEDIIDTQDDIEASKKPRPPVVTVMGHVDHGKTSLLDALRKTNIATSEKGGITQHIGAYQVITESGERVSFIDTPGHAAFTSMRARGAKVTDIVVLVVAADDGVKPQTIEALSHAKAAQVPIIVALNKMDKVDADPLRVKNELLAHEIIAEDMGGETQFVEISALKGEGLAALLESILLQAELLELKANPDREANGVVIEAKLEKGRGAVATILIQRGTLRTGDIFVVGEESGRVRALLNDRGEVLMAATPSMPVEILGANGVPAAGDMFNVMENEAKAREIANYRQNKARHTRTTNAARSSLDQMLKQIKETDMKELLLVIKTDVQGTAEAITQAIEELSNEEVRARVIHAGVGGVTESDITLAAASQAPVIGFNVRANAQARNLAEQTGIEIRYYNVIYDLVDDMKAAMAGLLTPDKREIRLGNAEILEIFDISKSNKIAGCRVADGLVRRGARVRLIRDDVVVHEGHLNSLRRFKDEVKEVNAGQECGMGVENYEDLKPGDVIECYEIEEIARTLDDVSQAG